MGTIQLFYVIMACHVFAVHVNRKVETLLGL